MIKNRSDGPAWAGGWAAVWLTLAVPCGAAGPAADQVLAYDPGTGYATEYGTGLGYTLTSAALGWPTLATEFGPVTPFNPPYDRASLLSLGQGGHLVVSLAEPLVNHPAHPFGIDFIIYGSAGFIDVNYPDGRTDESASIFGHNPGQTRVSVSADNQSFFVLDPALAPVVDGWFPTDGLGVVGQPVDPALDSQDLANRTLQEVRTLYGGAAGGTGYDLAWARDDQGQPVALEAIRYIRVDVVSGRSEIDAFMAVPEPSVWSLACLALGLGLCCQLWRSRAGDSTAGRSSQVGR